MSEAVIATFMGALASTFLLSRLFLWISKRWRSPPRIVLVHAIAAAMSCVASAFGFSDGGNLDWSYAPYYLVAQAVWLAIDLFREWRLGPGRV